MKHVYLSTLLLCLAPLSRASTITLPTNPFTVTAASMGNTFSYSGTLSTSDTLAFSVSGLSCLQTPNTYCTNAAGVVVIGGTTGVGGSSNNSGTAFGSLLLIIGGQTVQLFPTTSAYGLGSSNPPTAFVFPQTTLASLGFSFAPTLNAQITFQVSDTDRSDNSGQFTLTQTATPPGVPEPSTVLLLGSGLLALAGVRTRRRSSLR